MELKQLRYFMAVAEELNFTRAANRIGIAQPPLSQQIIALEHQLRAQLFVRTKRKVELTSSGEVLLSYARRLINVVQEAEEAVFLASRGGAGRLKIGAMYSTLHRLVPAILRESHLYDPHVVLDFSELTVAQQQQALNDGSIDLAIVRGELVGAHIASERLFAESFVVALPEQLTPPPGAVGLDWLAERDFVAIARRNNSDYTDQLQRYTKAHCGEINIVQEASDMPTLLCLVAAGIGVAIVPSLITDARIGGIVFRPIAGPTPVTSIRLAWRIDNNSPLLPRLLERVHAAVGADERLRTGVDDAPVDDGLASANG